MPVNSRQASCKSINNWSKNIFETRLRRKNSKLIKQKYWNVVINFPLVCAVLLISVNIRRYFFFTLRDPFKLAKTRSILNRCQEGQVLLINWSFAAHIQYMHIWSLSRWDTCLCVISLRTYSQSKNIIQFCFNAKWKWDNNYSNSNIQYTTNLLNILNREIKKTPKYAFYLMRSLNENRHYLTKRMQFILISM